MNWEFRRFRATFSSWMKYFREPRGKKKNSSKNILWGTKKSKTVHLCLTRNAMHTHLTKERDFKIKRCWGIPDADRWRLTGNNFDHASEIKSKCSKFARVLLHVQVGALAQSEGCLSFMLSWYRIALIHKQQAGLVLPLCLEQVSLFLCFYILLDCFQCMVYWYTTS